MTPPRLIAITDVQGRGWAETEVAMHVLCAGAAPGTVAVLLRDKAWPVRERLDLARRLRATTRKYRQLLTVAERLDVALLAEADGVHLGECSVAAADVRRLERAAPLWLTRAWHWPDAPDAPDADALLLSPIVEARKGRPALGWEVFERAVERAGSRPVYALGGVGAGDVAEAGRRGAAGVAVIGSAYTEPDVLLAALRVRR